MLRKEVSILIVALALGAVACFAAPQAGLRVADGVYCVGRGDWGGLEPLSERHDSNVFLLAGGEELALVDAGAGLGVDQILAHIANLGFDPARLRKILLTHAHYGHAGGVLALLKRFPSLEVFVGQADAAPLEKRNAEYLGYSLLRGMPPLESIPVHHPLHDGEVIKVGKVRVTAYGVAGHTPGSMAYLAEVGGQRVLFTGDTAIGNQAMGKGIVGWLDGHWHSNIADLDYALRRLFHLNAEMMLPGHGRWFKGRREVQENIENCQWRLNYLLRIPDLETMMPIGSRPSGP